MLSTELRILLAFLVAHFSAMYVIPKLANIARSIGLIDRPSKRKVHTSPRPLVGGIGIVITATFSSMLFVNMVGFRGLFLGLAVLLFIGFLDDFRELEAKSKFAAQILAAILMMYFSRTFLFSFGDLFGVGPIDIPDFDILIWLVTIFCIVGVVNSINLIDGLDGLAGGISFIAFLTFSLHASFAGESVLALINLAFAGAVLGFLRYNWQPAIVFMGDAGSLCLGFALAFMAIVLSQGENGCISPVIPLLVLAVPITDTVTVITKRLLKGKSPFIADQYHVHHVLMRYGMGRKTVVKVILGISIILSSITLLAPIYQISDKALFGVYLAHLTGYFITSTFIIHIMRLSLKYKRRSAVNGGKKKLTNRLAILFLDILDKLKIFRKNKRYYVELEAVLKIIDNGETLVGEIRNISDKGCMVLISGLKELQHEVVVQIKIPIDNNMVVIKFPAEHLWMSEVDDEVMHGFKFRELMSDDQIVFQKFMERLQKHTIFAQ